MLHRLWPGNNTAIAVTFTLLLLTPLGTLEEQNLTVSKQEQRPQYSSKHRMSAPALLRITSITGATTTADIALFIRWFLMKAKSATFMTRGGPLTTAGQLSQGNACSTVISSRKQTFILLFWLRPLQALMLFRKKTWKTASREKLSPMCPHVTGQLKTGTPTSIVGLTLPLMQSFLDSLAFLVEL